MSATTASTSAEDSRLAPSRTSKRRSKSADRISSSIAIRSSLTEWSDRRRVGQGVSSAGGGGLPEPDVAHLRLDAFNLEPDQRTVGEGEDDHSGRRIGLFEGHSEQVEDVVAGLVVQSEMRDAQDAVEAQQARHALRRPGFRADPVVAHAGDDKAAMARLPHHIGALDAGILHMRRDHFEALAIQREEFEAWLDDVHRQPVIRMMSAPQAPSFSSSR